VPYPDINERIAELQHRIDKSIRFRVVEFTYVEKMATSRHRRAVSIRAGVALLDLRLNQGSALFRRDIGHFFYDFYFTRKAFILD
jgi:hypothetical protein